ncbi:MAG: isoprenylcysteine carboxylmethyltransferase family protein [Ignavibacteriales bacterium]|nr:isoprenylcysteine carboxylmethyltransferase family protein [Ignavibacteriota bacterium]MCB9249018.1 isoprenylcysteine carboxylmethyltransferase family protein [Ignavibacteriales bacterium]
MTFTEKLRKILFKNRSYTPIPFLIIMVIFQQATLNSILLGLAIVIIGELFRYWGVVYAGSATRTTSGVGARELIVSGAFAHLRNPLYLGNILIYFGVGIMSMALFPYLQIFALIFFIFQYHLIIAEEEDFLTKTFGKKYEEYKAAVPKLFPRISAYKSNEAINQPLKLKAGLKSERRTLQAIVVTSLIIILQYIFI